MTCARFGTWAAPAANVSSTGSCAAAGAVPRKDDTLPAAGVAHYQAQ